MNRFIVGLLIGLCVPACFGAVAINAHGNMTCWHSSFNDPVYSGNIHIEGELLDAPGVSLNGRYYLCSDTNITCDVAVEE